MLTVGSPLSGALVVLNAVAPGRTQPATASVERAGGNALTGLSRLQLSPSASDALLRFTSQAAATHDANAPLRASVEGGNTAPASRDGIPPDKIAWLDSLGAERWEVRSAPEIDDATFHNQVLDNLHKNGSVKLAGFAEARANGTLTIQRAADMPELGYKSFQVTLYKSGAAYGGVGFSICNTDQWMAMRDSGIYAGTGMVSGTDYVATWPMPRAGDDLDPGTYEAA